ncbi:hypothetical protein QF038_000629 [Pseudarthrobacter sp. W1I19]|uniref:hypothetical protein n=1 Tax=Pseudarthrobacter sp. W1I19 TaxID=3042288 RepID=UPI00278B84FD|nr:hypothetical protein [Pseudarthrobacter sp. W1I19]MDQ0922121.1 hypothetical protein [Pseudarthrobacter sp. W1I19]
MNGPSQGGGGLEQQMQEAARGRTLLVAAARGAVCGLAGAAVMTASEKVEQILTQRPDSYVPARTLLTLLGNRPRQEDKPLLWNHAMHWGTGAALGALRGIWSATGIRGPFATMKHTGFRLAFDQTLENATGMGAPPSTWTPREQIVDVLHKAVYSAATGLAADRWIPPALESRKGATSH